MSSPKLQSLLQNGIVHHRAGRFADAERLYRQARELAADCFEALHWSGLLAYQQGHLEEAVEFLSQAHALDPAHAVCEMRYGLALLAVKRLAESETHLRHAVATKADFHEGWDSLASCLKAQGRFAEALACHEKSLWVAPGYARGWHNFGLTLLMTGADLDAVTCFDRALAANPNYRPAQLARAEAVQETVAA